MLKQRIITAVVLIAALVVALFALPTSGVILLFGAFIAAAAWEWGGLCGLMPAIRAAYVASMLTLGGVAMVAALADRRVMQVILAVAALWWVWAAIELRRGVGGRFHSAGGKLAAGALTMIPAWVALSFLYAADPRRPLVLLFVLAVVVAADTGAYAAGHAFGRTKLAPSISPGKTVEGVIGGVFGVMLLAYFCGTMVWHLAGGGLGAWVGLATVSGLISVVGDLSESKLKRTAGVKDSGNLLPGHGGVLDRIDALTAAAPAFAWGWLALFDAHT